MAYHSGRGSTEYEHTQRVSLAGFALAALGAAASPWSDAGLVVSGIGAALTFAMSTIYTLGRTSVKRKAAEAPEQRGRYV